MQRALDSWGPVQAESSTLGSGQRQAGSGAVGLRSGGGAVRRGMPVIGGVAQPSVKTFLN